MNTRAQKKQSLPQQITTETRTKQEELVGESVISKVNIDNEESGNKITSLNFRYNHGIKKLQITKTYPNDKNGFKAHKTRSRPIVLNLLNCIKQSTDGKVFDLMDVNTYIQLVSDQQQSVNAINQCVQNNIVIVLQMEICVQRNVNVRGVIILMIILKKEKKLQIN